MSDTDPFAPKPRVVPVDDVLAEQASIIANDVTTPCHCGAHQLKVDGEHVFPFRTDDESHTHVTCTSKDASGVWHPIESQPSVVTEADVTGPVDTASTSDPNVVDAESTNPPVDEGAVTTDG